MNLYTGGAGTIVFNKDMTKILLGKRTDGNGWCLCGGKREDAEKPIETAIRESREEFGITISPEDMVFMGKIYAKVMSRGELVNVISNIFATCEFTGMITPQLTEIEEIRWCDFYDILDLDKIFPTTLASINRFVYPIWDENFK